MSIYLYIKQHAITGKLYFGKTVQKPETYLGSGKHWLRHIKKHGKEHVVTLWYCLFLDQTSCTEFALNFSRQQNIVESEDWLNLVIEDGLDGGTRSTAPKSIEMRQKLSQSRKGIVFSDSHKKKLSEKKKKPVMIEGKRYDCMDDAAAALNLTRNQVGYRIMHKTKFQSWYYVL